MVAQVARAYEGRVQFITSPGQDSPRPMHRFVQEFGWPDSMVHAVDSNGELWAHFKVRFRGAWIFVDDDGRVLHQSASHIPEAEVRSWLDRLLAE